MHPMKKGSVESHNAKLKAMTSEYGAASGPANNIMASDEREKGEGPAPVPGFGSESGEPRARGDRSSRRPIANPVATYAKGGGVNRARGGRAKGKTNIVIHVSPGNTTPPQPAAAPQAMQPHPAMPLPTAPPPMAPPQGLMPAGGPPPGAMPLVGMPRKRGGRADGGAADYDAQGLGVPMAEDRNPAPGDVYSRGSDGVMQKTKIQPAYRKTREAEDPALARKRGGRAYYDLEGGAGSGLGRLEKAGLASA